MVERGITVVTGLRVRGDEDLAEESHDDDDDDDDDSGVYYVRATLL